jgi:hypothetical protein
MRLLTGCLVVLFVVACDDPPEGGVGGGSGSGGGYAGGNGGSAGGGSGGGSAGGGSGGGSGGGGAIADGGTGGGGTAGGSGGGLGGGTGGGASTDGGFVGPDGGVSPAMTFFVTSRGAGKGGDLRNDAGQTDGLIGADALCKTLANAVHPSLGAKSWHAYLSTAAVNARDRVGAGPWVNAKGVVIAQNVNQLHDVGGMNALSYTNTLDELGNQVPISGNNVHDILTGSTVAGMVSANNHCSNWTSAATNVTGQVGHANRDGGGTIPTSWNSAHATTGCAESGANSVRSGGGRGSIYCFAD